MSTYLDSLSGHVLSLEKIEAPSYLKEYLSYAIGIKHLSQQTVMSYYIQLRAFLRWIKCRYDPNITLESFRKISIIDVPFSSIEEITTTDLYEFLTFSTTILKNDVTTKSIKLTAIKAFFSYYCEDAKRLETNPAERIPAPKRGKKLPKYLSLEESTKLLDSIDGNMQERDYCIVTFFLNCGMRLSELAGINITDIRDDTLRLFGKGQKERIVYLNSSCIEALQDYLKVRGEKISIKEKAKNALWISRKGNRLTRRRIEQIVDERLKAAGLGDKGYSPHKLRHTAATLMYQNGSANILELKELLGHEHISTTEIYTHLEQSHLRAAAANAPLANRTRKGNKS